MSFWWKLNLINSKSLLNRKSILIHTLHKWCYFYESHIITVMLIKIANDTFYISILIIMKHSYIFKYNFKVWVHISTNFYFTSVYLCLSSQNYVLLFTKLCVFRFGVIRWLCTKSFLLEKSISGASQGRGQQKNEHSVLLVPLPSRICMLSLPLSLSLK